MDHFIAYVLYRMTLPQAVAHLTAIAGLICLGRLLWGTT